MLLTTTRFGSVRIDDQDILAFPAGMPGLEYCREWVLLADCETSALAWLQSVTRPEVAIGCVNPRRFVPDYQLRLSPRAFAPLRLEDPRAAQVLIAVARAGECMTLNLKAPIVLNLDERLGAQLVNNLHYAVDYPLRHSRAALKKSA